jgi:hypothetical protein
MRRSGAYALDLLDEQQAETILHYCEKYLDD